LKARTLIITAGAMFALAAPAAQANPERMLPAKASVAAHHKIVATHHKVTAKQHKVSKSTAPWYIYFPGTPNQPAPYVDDCATSGNNCAEQQLCLIWGMNCDLIGTTTYVALPAESTPVETAPSTDQSDPGRIDNSSSDNSSADAQNALRCRLGGVWDEDCQYT
jgi:hypothetical protein